MGYTVGTNVRITTQEQRSFLKRLAAKVPFDFFVTSGSRDAYEQAAAMLKKVELGGREELTTLYADKVYANAVADAYPDIEMAALIVQRKFDASTSAHSRGLAVDIRTRTLSSEQIEELQKAVQQLGATSLLELVPPHLHVEIPEKKRLPFLLPVLLLSGLALTVKSK